MTTDELVYLCEALTAEINVVDLVKGYHSELVERFTPEQLGLLIRFLSGERPSLAAELKERYPVPPGPTVPGRRLEPLPLSDEDDPDYDPVDDVFILPKKEREDPDHELPLTGEFDGVFLP